MKLQWKKQIKEADKRRKITKTRRKREEKDFEESRDVNEQKEMIQEKRKECLENILITRRKNSKKSRKKWEIKKNSRS